MNLFNIESKVILITGGGGILGGEMANYLIQNGATVVILDYQEDIVNNAITKLKKKSDNVSGFVCNALDEQSLKKVSDKIIAQYGKIDILINAAGGNMPGATIGEDQTIFDVNTFYLDVFFCSGNGCTHVWVFAHSPDT